VNVRIFRKLENPMQQGRNNANAWLLEYEVPHAWKADPLTGWQGSGDTRGQVTLTFATRETAIAFAEREGLPYHVVPDATRTLKVQSYAANFAGGGVEAPGTS
jgi:hypothetical protein